VTDEVSGRLWLMSRWFESGQWRAAMESRELTLGTARSDVPAAQTPKIMLRRTTASLRALGHIRAVTYQQHRLCDKLTNISS